MQKQVGRYLLIQEIGHGQFGKVYKAFDTQDNNKEYAVKVMSRQKVESAAHIHKLFRSEIEIMRTIHHPNLLFLQDFLETASNFYVVVPFLKDGDMEKKLEKTGPIEEAESVFYLKQIMAGFLYLHSHKIMHRDFKVANIFLEGNHLVIGDFGFAKAGVEVAMTKLGTPYNMAPEILFSNGYIGYTSKADLWSIGVVFYQMLTGQLPFRASTMDQLKQMVKTMSGPRVPFPPNIIISEDSKNLIRSLLEFDANKRIGWKEFFVHPIFTFYSEFGPATKILNQSLCLESHAHILQGLPPPGNPWTNQSSANNSMNQRSLQGQSILSQRPSVTSITPNVDPNATLNQLVENQFKQARQLVCTDPQFSVYFEVPATADLMGGSSVNSKQQNESFQFGSTAAAMSNATGRTEDANNFLAHERNKYLLVFQTAKRWKDMLKNELIREKFWAILLIATALCKRGLIMIDFLAKTIRNKADVFKVSGFTEFCSSPLGEKYLAALQEDRANFFQFQQYLENKMEEEHYSDGADESMKTAVRHQANSENYIDVIVDKLLVHLIAWMQKVKKPRLQDGGLTYNQFNLAAVYTHYCLNLNYEFPLQRQGSLFKWKQFFTEIDGLDEHRISPLLYKYYQKPDEISASGCFLFDTKKILC